MKDCLFCKIAAGEIPSYTIYEDEEFRAFLDIEPAGIGHTLIVPKQHIATLNDLSPAHDALKLAIWSDKGAIPKDEVERLRALWGRHFASP